MHTVTNGPLKVVRINGVESIHDWSKLSKSGQIYHNYLEKLETSITTYDIDNGKLNITGLSGRINGVKL